ncbi:MAG TPA: methyltransferase domain-containing protein [Gemmatimonadaceae bacterium]|nr:methyltransferase domain-containing protein [Gemmatimonadaceae bacterium]
MTDEALDGKALVDSLERRFRTSWVDVHVADRTYNILKPANADDLIREEDFVKDERLPYWADIWPSSVILAAKLLESDGGGRTALELGCGVGLCTIAATSAGYDVLSTDYYEDALEFTRANVFTSLGAAARTKLFDWRHPPKDLPRFDLAFASDVLYEREYALLLPQILRRALAPRGQAMIADPGRVAAPMFVEACEELGIAAEKIETRPFESGEIRQRIDIYLVSP